MISSTPCNRVETLTSFPSIIRSNLCVSAAYPTGRGCEEGTVTSRGRGHSPSFSRCLREAEAARHQAYWIGDCLFGDEPGDQRPLLGAESHANLRSGLCSMSGFIPLKVTGELVSQPHLNPPKCLRGRGNQPWARLSFSILEGVSQPGVAVLQLCLPLCNAQLCPAGPGAGSRGRDTEAGVFSEAEFR